MINMTAVIARIKIFPIDVGIKSKDIVDSICELLPKGMIVKKTMDEPIAFGLSAAILDIQLEEDEGSMDLLEEAIKKSPKVSQIEIIGVSRVSTSIG